MLCVVACVFFVFAVDWCSCVACCACHVCCLWLVIRGLFLVACEALLVIRCVLLVVCCLGVNIALCCLVVCHICCSLSGVVVYCALFIARRVLPIMLYAVFGVRCLPLTVCDSLFVVCCLWWIVHCVSCFPVVVGIVCGLVCGAWCLLFG